MINAEEVLWDSLGLPNRYMMLLLINGVHVHAFKVLKQDVDVKFPYTYITLRNFFIGSKVYVPTVMQKKVAITNQNESFKSFKRNWLGGSLGNKLYKGTFSYGQQGFFYREL